MATTSAFRWSQIGEVTESLTLSSRSMDEFYPELRVHLDRPPETVDCVGRSFDCVGSPQYSRSPTGRNAFTANGCATKPDKVKVYVRMRPFSESEKVCPLKQVLCLIGETIVVRDLDQKLTGISKEPPHKPEAIEFKVDYMQDDSYLQVHSEMHKEESQKRMYGALGVPCIESALDGYNTTILAYGQTGSGKTYTMMGDSTTSGKGLIPRLANDLMAKINEESSNGVLYTVQVSYLEIYQEKIRDLLAEDEMEEEAKPLSIPQTSLHSTGMNSNEKVRAPVSNPEMKFRVSGNNLEEKVIHSYAGSMNENSYTSSFLNKAALQRQLEASQKHSRTRSDGERSPPEKPHGSSAHDGVTNKVRSPKAKPAFDTVFNKQKMHKHYRTFPTVLEEAPPLRKQNFLKIREHPVTGPFVEGLLWKDVCTWYDMETLMIQGSTSRTTAATNMNEQSSRSHAVFSIRLTKKLGPDLFGVHPSSVSYINLVDLAGSEKLPKLCSGAVTGQRTQEESRCINRSLSQLNEVILSLSKSSFVSYRNSVLTWLLKESLGGNSRTFMVANISPTEKDLRESINTLRYATTASRIPPPVALDQDPRNKLIKTLKEEICTLRTLLSSFTSVKENTPSGQLPSLQGFKVPCLDVGLQVERNFSDHDGSRGRKLQQLFDKGSQTENHVKDIGQQTISRSASVDDGFQIALKDGGALDMGNPTVLQDTGRVDIGPQALILNVCACQFAHQASAKDFGVLEGTVSQQSTLCDWEDKVVCLEGYLQGSGSVYRGQQTPLRDCGDVEDKILMRDWGNGDVGSQLPVQNWGVVTSWTQATSRDGREIDDRIWVTLQIQDEINAGNEIALADRKDGDDTNCVETQNCGAINGGNQTSPNWRPVDAGNQIVVRDGGNVDAKNQITLRDCGHVRVESQISSTDWSPVAAGLQTSFTDFGGIYVGNEITARDSGVTDAVQQTNPADCGSKNADQQPRLLDHGVNKATNCTVAQLDVSHQIDWREFGSSDAGLQVTPRTRDAGFQVSWEDFGASDNAGQISRRDFGMSDMGHQVTAYDQGGHRHQHNILKDCKVVDDEFQIDRRSLKLFDFGQQVSWTKFCQIDIAQQVDLNNDTQGIVPDDRFHWKNDGSVKCRHSTHPNVLAGTKLSPQMTLGHSDGIGTGHETAARLLDVVDAGKQGGGKDNESVGSTHRITGWGSYGGRIEPKDLTMIGIGLSASTSDVRLEPSQADCGTSETGNQVIITSETRQHNLTSRCCRTTHLGFSAWCHDGGALRAGTGTFHIIRQNRWADDVGQAALKKLGKAGQQIFLYPSTAHDNSALMISKETFTRNTVNRNNGGWRRTGAVEVGHPNVLANLGAIDASYEAGLRVGLVEERKEQFEWRNLSVVRRGQHTTSLESPGISVVQQASPRGIGTDSIGHQTSLKVKEGEGKVSHSDWKHLAADVGHPSTLQDCGKAIGVRLQTNLEILGVVDTGLQTSRDDTGVKDSQLGRRDDVGVEFGCAAELKDYRFVGVSHQGTSTDFESHGVDQWSADKYRTVEVWKCFRCRDCEPIRDNSVVVVSTTSPVEEVAADAGLQTSGIDFCATASELQTPTIGCWGVSPDADPITLKVLEAIVEGSQIDWEELHPCHEEHPACWNHFGASDFQRQPFCKASKSLDLEERRPSVKLGDVHVKRQNHWKECKICNSGCQNCQQDSIAQKRQDQAYQEVGQDTVIHSWQHLHEIMLSEPNYLVRESDADTLNTKEKSGWNARLEVRHQNPRVYRDHIRGMQFLQDVKLEQVGDSKAEILLQCTQCRVVDGGFQALPRDCAAGQVEQHPGGGALESITHTIDERFESFSSNSRILKKADGDAICGIPQTETIQEDRSGACETGQRLDGKLEGNRGSVCLSWLRDFAGRKKLTGNVPAEEAFQLCSLWTVAKLRSRIEWYSGHTERDFLKHRFSLATKCRRLVSQPPNFSKADVATQTASCPEDSTNHKTDLSNALQHICLLWVFVVLRIAAPDKMSVKEGKRQAGKRSPFLASAAPRKIRILSCLSHPAIDQRRFISSRDYRTSRLKHLRYSGVEPLTFQSTTPFFIQTSGDGSLLGTRVERGTRTGNTVAGGCSYKVMCGSPSRRVIHFLKEGVNGLGSNRGADIFVNGLSEDHSEFVYMPAHRCVQKKGYVVARLVAPGAMAFLNGLPMLEHKELCTGDVLVLRDLRYWSCICTLHFFDLVKFS